MNFPGAIQTVLDQIAPNELDVIDAKSKTSERVLIRVANPKTKEVEIWRLSLSCVDKAKVADPKNDRERYSV